MSSGSSRSAQAAVPQAHLPELQPDAEAMGRAESPVPLLCVGSSAEGFCQHSGGGTLPSASFAINGSISLPPSLGLLGVLVPGHSQKGPCTLASVKKAGWGRRWGHGSRRQDAQ